jgi:general L-amino acid transport system permease protein
METFPLRAAAAKPPRKTVLSWLRENFFATAPSAASTIIILYIGYLIVPKLVGFLVLDAVWEGSSRTDCLESKGACWPFISNRIGYLIYGDYPRTERWRVNLTVLMAAIGTVWLLWRRIGFKGLGLAYFFVILPVCGFVLLLGLPVLDLQNVATVQWGGMFVTFVIAFLALILSLPAGVLLALGRRSELFAVRILSVVLIEVGRAAPMVMVLFLASRMLPLFLPTGMDFDPLLRVILGIALLSSTYMAEVVRGGLQAIPKGQYEAAMAIGLGYWHTMFLIILPQALRISIPGILNTAIGLFKDTTLVTIVGIFDFLATVHMSTTDPEWSTATTAMTGYAFSGLFYFVCCFSMAQYAAKLERATDHTRASDKETA